MTYLPSRSSAVGWELRRDGWDMRSPRKTARRRWGCSRCPQVGAPEPSGFISRVSASRPRRLKRRAFGGRRAITVVTNENPRPDNAEGLSVRKRAFRLKLSESKMSNYEAPMST